MRWLETNKLTGKQVWKDDLGLVLLNVHGLSECAGMVCSIHRVSRAPDPDDHSPTACPVCDGCCKAPKSTEADVNQQADETVNSVGSKFDPHQNANPLAKGLARTYTVRLPCTNCTKVTRKEFPYGTRMSWIFDCPNCGCISK